MNHLHVVDSCQGLLESVESRAPEEAVGFEQLQRRELAFDFNGFSFALDRQLVALLDAVPFGFKVLEIVFGGEDLNLEGADPEQDQHDQ